MTEFFPSPFSRPLLTFADSLVKKNNQGKEGQGKGPKTEKIQDRPPGTENFKRSPEGPERHLNAARQKKLPRDTLFAAQLPRNYPHRGGNFEGGQNVLSCGGEAIWEAF